MSTDFIKRLEVEIEELQERYNRLDAFLGTTAAISLDNRMHMLMVQQKHIMKDYIEVLSARWELLHEDDESDPQCADRSAAHANVALEPGLNVPDDVDCTECGRDDCPCEK